MTLFEHQAERQMDREAPLAARLRPRTFDEFVGQQQEDLSRLYSPLDTITR